MALLFTHATLLPMSAGEGEAQTFVGALGIVGERIALVTASESEVAAFRAQYPDVQEIDCRGKLVMPGLINTHCHAAMTLQRSSADDIALMAWLNDYIWPFEAKQTVEDIRVGMELAFVELLLGGVTSVVDMYFHQSECVEVAERMGIRALLGASYFDHSVEETLADARVAAERAKGSARVRIAIAPHAPYTVSPENLLRGKALCEELDLPLMIHLAETQDEARIVQERYGETPVALLDKLGLLTSKTIAAHCIHLSDEDIQTLVERGVVISHNPQSNMKISSGVAPLKRLLEAGAKVTLATDGPCSNNDLDMWEELRSASFLQKVTTGDPLTLPAYEALKLMTVNGAQAMGYAEGELGVLRAGALADVIVVDLQKPHLQPIHDVVANLVYCAKASDVETVVVGGRMVVRERKVVGVDLPSLYQRVESAVRRIKHQ